MNIQKIVGKTIKAATQMKKPEYDDDGWLRLEFTDGTKCDVVSSYGGWTAESEDEYPTGICVAECDESLIPVNTKISGCEPTDKAQH